MLRLNDSKEVRKEYKTYQHVIDNIENSDVKAHGQLLLDNLTHECNLVDQRHDPSNNIKIDPVSLKENISRIVEIRRQLNQLVKDSK